MNRTISSGRSEKMAIFFTKQDLLGYQFEANEMPGNGNMGGKQSKSQLNWLYYSGGLKCIWVLICL